MHEQEVALELVGAKVAVAARSSGALAKPTPTATQRRDIEIARGDFAVLSRELSNLLETDLVQLEADLEAVLSQ